MDKQKNFDFGYEIPAEFEAELSSWNDRDVAFIKSDYQNGKDMWLIYAADGTKLATTGGFLKAGNVTILIGLEESKLDACFDIIREHSSTRKQIIPTTAELGMGFFPSAPVQVDVGGATVFVLGGERFEKL